MESINQKRWGPNNLGKGIGTSTERYRGHGIHGNNLSIGKYISAGCIRMINEDGRNYLNICQLRQMDWDGRNIRGMYLQYIEYEEKLELCF